MRSVTNRIFHTISFELLGLGIITPVGALVLGKPLHEIGVVTLAATLIATFWNYFYNLGFDKAMLRLRGSPVKTPFLRLVHAAVFELGLLLLIVPLAAWWLGIGLVQALVLDLGFAGFYLVYAMLFNWAWERVFPYQMPQLGPDRGGRPKTI